MKKITSGFMAIIVISLVILLILNTMAIFAYRDEVLSLEIRKNTLASMESMEELNRQEDRALEKQKALEASLVVVSLLLLGFTAATFYLTIREKTDHAYSSKLYTTAVEKISDGIAILDSDYRFEFMNPKYKEIMGLSPETPGGKAPKEVFDKQVAQIIEELTVFRSDGEGQAELFIGKRKKYIQYSCVTIEDARGNDKYVHLIRDNTVTEELQMQRSDQLEEIKLYSQAKDSFIANISHEIKTPINAILGMVHFLKNTQLSESQRDLVRKIETSSDILLTIISDVLDLTKIKSGSLKLYPCDFFLEAAIHNVEDMFSNQLASRDIAWRTDYRFSRDLCLHLDKTRFVQVLVNLINNACKFTDAGYIKLTAEALREDEDTVQLRFCVEDTGIGIAREDISRLFHEFEQLENHLTKQHQGTGLGLYICKNIIESMGGRMWVESKKSEGSRFYFSLPAKKAPPQVCQAAEKAMCAKLLDGRGGRALVVEDMEINAEVAVKLLNDVNIACDTAVDGEEAIQACRDKPADYYNVILMDIHMPRMDGYTAAGILKKEMGVAAPIIALTASDINDQVRREHRDTIEAFLLKPFKADAFYNTIAPCFPNPLAGREEAIRNLGGQEALYEKHAKKFKANYADAAEHIAALLAEKNYAEARRHAHSIKGLSGTLGMLRLMEAAAALEQAILKGDDPGLTASLERFSKELKVAIDVI